VKRAGLAAALLILVAAAALAYIPPVERVAARAADTNRLGGRAQALALSVVVRGEGDATLAKGTLLSDPRGMARLELAHSAGFVERQLRRGRGFEASRGGEPLADAHPLLPPLWVLQASPGAELMARIAELGGDPNVIALGFEGDHDCFVLGGRTSGASYWVDQDSFAAVRIDLPGDIHYRLGPPQRRGAIELPGWVTLEAPGRPPVTLAIESARVETAPPDAFSPGWLAR
jgi:hypothetical protein